MPAPHQILVGVLACPTQVPHRLVLGRGRVHLGQQPRPIQLRQLACVTPVRLDPIPRLPRDQRRGHHHAARSRFLYPALQRVAARARLVAETHLPWCLALHLPHHPSHRPRFVRELPLHRLRLLRQQHRHLDHDLVRVLPNEGDTLAHDRLLSYAALAPLQTLRQSAMVRSRAGRSIGSYLGVIRTRGARKEAR